MRRSRPDMRLQRTRTTWCLFLAILLVPGGASADVYTGTGLASTWLHTVSVGGKRIQLLSTDVDVYASYLKLTESETPLLFDVDLRLSEQFRPDGAANEQFEPYLREMSFRYGGVDNAWRLQLGRMFVPDVPRSTIFEGVRGVFSLSGNWQISLFAGRDLLLEDTVLKTESFDHFDRGRLGLGGGWTDARGRSIKGAVYLKDFEAQPLPYFYLAGSYVDALPFGQNLFWTVIADLDIPLLMHTRPEAGVILRISGESWSEQVSYRTIVPDYEPDSIYWVMLPYATNLIEERFEYTVGLATLHTRYQFSGAAAIFSSDLGEVADSWSHLIEIGSNLALMDELSVDPSVYWESTLSWQAVGIRCSVPYRKGDLSAGFEPFGEMRSSELADRDDGLFYGARLDGVYAVWKGISIFANLTAASGEWLSPYMTASLGAMWQQ